MDFFTAVSERYSVRAYQATPISEAALQAILSAANDAPSGGNLQGFEIVVVRDPARKHRLAQASLDQGFIAQAPVALVFLTNPDRSRSKYGQRGAELYATQDATIACAYAQLAATALGLASCWVGAFTDDPVRAVVGAPAHWRPVAILPIGHPADPRRPRERRGVIDVTHQEQVRR